MASKMQLKGGIVLTLPEQLPELLQKEMQEELIEAESKWGVLLGEDERNTVHYHAVSQLESRISRFAGVPWDVTDRKLYIKVAEFVTSKRVLELPSTDNQAHQYNFTRIRDSIAVAADSSELKISAEEFQEFIVQLMRSWSRTAVFYGVGSYR